MAAARGQTCWGSGITHSFSSPNRLAVDEAGGPGEGHFGLTLMRERAHSVDGTLSLRSDVEAGTRVRLQVPAP